MKTICIAVKKPSGGWKAQTVEDALPTYQDIVGGYIENFETTKTGVHFFCNEEGKLRNLEPNMISSHGDVIVGTVFAVRSDEEGEFCSLTDADLFDLFSIMPENAPLYALYQGSVMVRIDGRFTKDGKEYAAVTFDNDETANVLMSELQTTFDFEGEKNNE